MAQEINAKKYIELSERTCKYIPEDGIIIQPEMYNLLHAALGMSGEAGELVDIVKKSFIYNKPLDKNHAKEEIGDCLWYIALACRTLGVSFDELMYDNISKLSRRYPDRYTDEHAVARADKADGDV